MVTRTRLFSQREGEKNEVKVGHQGKTLLHYDHQGIDLTEGNNRVETQTFPSS